MHSLEDTICAIATPPGNGAIAVLRLSGKDSKVIANNVFSKDLDTISPNTLHYGKITTNGEVVDEVVLSYFQAPNSYTGQDVIEISCHGSEYIQNKLLETLIAEGARLAEPGEFTQRAFLNKKMDLSQAEAVADLIASESKATHQLALQQMRGGYSAEIEQLRQELIDFASLIELELDFGEEDVEFADRKKLLGLIDTIQQKIGPLIESFKYGNVIKNGVQTVIAGRPNAGKSTLLNTLLKEDRAIVSEVAGTTRDTIEEIINVKGTLFQLIDTAGIRDATDTIEKIGVEKARQKVEQSAVLLYVFDINELSPADVVKDIQSMEHANLSIILLANKYDVFDAKKEQGWNELAEKYSLYKVSAKTGDGVEEVLVELESKFNTENKGHSLVVTNTRHYEALQNAQAALEKTKENLQQNVSGDFVAMDIREALRHLGSITGAVDVDKDILGNIFGKFCIGK